MGTVPGLRRPWGDFAVGFVLLRAGGVDVDEPEQRCGRGEEDRESVFQR